MVIIDVNKSFIYIDDGIMEINVVLSYSNLVKYYYK